MKQKHWIALAALILTLSLLSACAGKERPTEPVTFAEPLTDGPSAADPTDYAALAALQFADLAESDAADFEVSDVTGGVAIAAYKGSDAKVRIPEVIGGKQVVAIANAAFQNNTTLTALYIPDSVSDFGTDILAGCNNLYALHTPLSAKEGTRFLGYLFGAKTYERQNVESMWNLDFLELGGALTELPRFALYDCNDLVTVLLPEETAALGAYSLYRCESLKYINAEGLTGISDYAMAYCSSLQSLAFSQSLTSIGLGALEGCTALRSLTLPFVGGSATENTYLGYLFGAADPAFSPSLYPVWLTRVTLLDTCKTLGDYAFYGCDSLQTVDFAGAEITSIGVRAFSGCVRLASLALPNSLQSIRENAFTGCISLSSMTFGTSLQSIGIGAFADCSALQSVILPSSLKGLPSSCFAGCGRLQEIDLGGVEDVGKNAFYNCPSLVRATANGKVTLADGNEALKLLLSN